MRSTALALVVLAACAYEPSSYSFLVGAPAASRATIGCLDLAISPREPVSPERHTVVAYAFGNRCDRPAVVDLASVPVVGHGLDGRRYALAAFDPEGELRPALLDGRDQATELIAYPSGTPLVDVCVDAAAIAHHAPSRWLCVMTRSP